MSADVMDPNSGFEDAKIGIIFYCANFLFNKKEFVLIFKFINNWHNSHFKFINNRLLILFL
ncbi:hypothetical protein BXY58_0006 [Epilithonimonas arachidiradicis]|uniref:Uncharacterized protein n=1 Tax=Epilithonimonas arachidiradicis TaxID=1617282 RepID=A0A420DC16_9FLAO|nr:hypothetical protein BXY58_0006 [Epilithonimonas arachidiradicis]